MIVTDVSAWPLVEITLEGETTVGDIDAQLAAFATACVSGGAWALVVDLRRARMTPFLPGHIRRVDDWLWTHRDDVIRQCAGVAVVVDESVASVARELVRGLTDTLGGAITCRVISEKHRAQTWVLDRLETRGRTVLMGAI